MHLKNKSKNNGRSHHTSSNLQMGVVYKKVTGSYTVYVDGQSAERSLNCALSAQLRQTPDPVAVGDHVLFDESRSGMSVIVEVLPRDNRLARRSPVPMPGAHAFEQVIAANVGQVVPVFAATNPPPRWNMLDRYLVTAEANEVPALIVITKLDLAHAEPEVIAELQEAAAEYRRIGYPVLLVSAYSGEGIEELKSALAGKISVFLGKSGVGKSSLLNAIQPGLGQRVNTVSNGMLGKGRHTTTHMEMFPIGAGGSIVDTPGVREFGLWDVEEDDLALYFPEMRPYLGQCRFGLDCRHDEEPGCAIRKAVMEGHISPRRYQSYMKLKNEE